jgi:hypothetical protein
MITPTVRPAPGMIDPGDHLPWYVPEDDDPAINPQPQPDRTQLELKMRY